MKREKCEWGGGGNSEIIVLTSQTKGEVCVCEGGGGGIVGCLY